MSIQKITTYVALALGVLGLIFQVLILRAGDDVIEMNSLTGNFSTVSPMIYLACLLIFLVFNVTMLSSTMGRMFLSLTSLIYLIGSFIILPFSLWFYMYCILIFIISTILLYVNYDQNKYKRTLFSIAAFLFVVLISFLFSEGVETPMKDGEVLSAAGSRWVGTGLRTFYILAFGAIGAMIFSGVKRFFK